MPPTTNDTQSAPEPALWRNLYPLTLGMMALPFWCLLVAVFGFIVWIPMTKYHLLVAFVLTLGTIAWGCRWERKKSLFQGAIFTAVMLLCGIYTSLFFEKGYWYSPLTYHKPSVLAMQYGWNPVWEYTINGWNPIWEHLIGENDSEGDQGLDEDLGDSDRWWPWWPWSKHFPKADWYINAVFYAFSGNLDLGHLSRVCYLFVTFVVVFAAIAAIFRLPDYQSFCLAFTAAVNPFSIGFCFSGYLDGAFGSCLTLLFFAFAAYLKSKDKRFLPFVVASIVIVTNFKFTGVVYVAVFLICMLIPYAFPAWALRTLRLKNKKNKSEGRKESLCIDRTLTGSLVLATVLALIVGINPYLYHLYHHYTPFYPLHTIRKMDEPDRMYPMREVTGYNIGGANKLQQFFFYYLNISDYRLTIRPHCDCEGEEHEEHCTMEHQMKEHWVGKEDGVHTLTVNKVPFNRYSTNHFEHAAFPFSDAKFHGMHLYHDHHFGNLFMVSMWFSLLMMPLIRRKEFWFLLLAVWASIWIQPHLWYARYIPHLWIIPIIVSCSLLSQFNEIPEYRRRFMVIVGAVLLCMLVSVQPFVQYSIPRAEKRGTGIIAYFVKNHPDALFFDMAVSIPEYGHSIIAYISDLLPDCSFEQSDERDDNVAESEALSSHEAYIMELLSATPYASLKQPLAVFLQCCHVYLVAENQRELDRLASIEPSRMEMTKAILHLRWQQFKRAWED